MRKDIEIPKVTQVHIVAVHEWDKDFLAQNWFVYLVNESNKTLETTLVCLVGMIPIEKPLPCVTD